jgi:hypothetical protein
MGEYLHDVKLGTCEDLYYTTYDQLKKWQVSGKDEFLKLNSGYRFRFPFPDEKIPIGTHSDYNRGFPIRLPKGIFSMNHGKAFIRTDSNMNIKSAFPIGFYVECPLTNKESLKWENAEYEVYEIVQQKFCTDEETGLPMLQTVLRCPYCGELARMSFGEAKEVSKIIFEQSEKTTGMDKITTLVQISNIIIDGYLNNPQDGTKTFPEIKTEEKEKCPLKQEPISAGPNRSTRRQIRLNKAGRSYAKNFKSGKTGVRYN